MCNTSLILPDRDLALPMDKKNEDEVRIVKFSSYKVYANIMFKNLKITLLISFMKKLDKILFITLHS